MKRTECKRLKNSRICRLNAQKLWNKITISSNVTVERYKKTYRDMIIRREKKAFTLHAIAYAIGNSILIAINLLVVPQFLWFMFPLVEWGSGLAIHYYLGVRSALRRIDKDELMAENMAREGLGASLA